MRTVHTGATVRLINRREISSLPSGGPLCGIHPSACWAVPSGRWNRSTLADFLLHVKLSGGLFAPVYGEHGGKKSRTKTRVTSGGVLELFPKCSEVPSHPYTYPEASVSCSSCPVISE